MVKHPDEAQNPIENHGIIGDMRSAALVADTGSIDFFCWPDFDSPSVFCALLDSNEAGIFQLAPDLPDARREQIYQPDTNVLLSRWISKDAVVERRIRGWPLASKQTASPSIFTRMTARL